MQFSKEISGFKQSFIEMIKQFESMKDVQLCRITVAKHRIVLSPRDESPIHLGSYWASPKQRQPEREKVGNKREIDVAEAAIISWALPVVFVSEKSKSLRFFVDYYRLNATSKRDSYTIPQLDECIDSLGAAQMFFLLPFPTPSIGKSKRTIETPKKWRLRRTMGRSIIHERRLK